ncbi:tyrosine-type recombinase/integrase [Flexivirga caeni]|uniref:Site-specific integrase n=1 Tax=Flexivirga caeni TaxID=2294115 RepID=A0A3M9MHE1_9MICO|nr:site-specific integrase [Flexivirga caeni]RNI24595.1 site-specific integrase [Flexivirga caeni]
MAIVTTMDFDRLLDQYVADLIDRGRRPATVRGYRTDLRKLGQSLGGRELTAERVTRHLASLTEFAPATRARHTAALRSFLRWYDARTPGRPGLLRLLDGASPRRDTPTHPSPPAGGSTTTDPHADCDGDAALRCIPRQADRDHLFFGLIRRLGLRPSEALNLRVEDIDRSARHLDVPGWGGIRRRVYVDDLDVHLRLLNWREAIGRTSGALFAGENPEKPVSYQAMAKRWDRYVREAAVVSHLGDLRRAHLAELTAGGIPASVIAQRLGLRNLPITSWSSPAQDSDQLLDAWHDARHPADVGKPKSPRRTSGA